MLELQGLETVSTLLSNLNNLPRVGRMELAPCSPQMKMRRMELVPYRAQVGRMKLVPCCPQMRQTRVRRLAVCEPPHQSSQRTSASPSDGDAEPEEAAATERPKTKEAKTSASPSDGGAETEDSGKGYEMEPFPTTKAEGSGVVDSLRTSPPEEPEESKTLTPPSDGSVKSEEAGRPHFLLA